MGPAQEAERVLLQLDDVGAVDEPRVAVLVQHLGDVGDQAEAEPAVAIGAASGQR